MNIRYVVNEEKRTVVAIIENEESTMAYRIHKATKGALSVGFLKTLFVDERCIGKAKCDPRDEFDIKEGKRLAARRASAAYELACWKKVVKHLIPLGDAIQECVDRQMKIFNHEHHRLNEIESEMLGDEE